MQSYIPGNEKELLRLVAQGDQEAFRALFEHYWDKVYSTALLLSKSPELAEDIAQDVFTQLWIKKEEVAGIENLDNYLFIVARNRILSRLRREARSDAYLNYLKRYFSEETLPADIRAEFNEARQLLFQAIGQMPPQQQRAFRLSRFEGLNHQEIAEKMQVSRPTVKTYIVKSIAFLRKFMKEHAIVLIAILYTRYHR